MNRLLKIALSIPRSIYVNLRLFPFKTAIKLPLVVANNTRIECLKGKIVFEKPIRPAMIRFGFHKTEVCDESSVHSILCLMPDSQWVIGGGTHIGHGAVIHIESNGILKTGDNFAISGTTKIICSKDIRIGNDVQFSWDTLVMDSDSHVIYDEDGKMMNPDAPIVIGNKVWLACNLTVLKGTIVGNNCVVGACSKLCKDYKEDNSLIVGNPAKVVKQIGGWHL